MQCFQSNLFRTMGRIPSSTSNTCNTIKDVEENATIHSYYDNDHAENSASKNRKTPPPGGHQISSKTVASMVLLVLILVGGAAAALYSFAGIRGVNEKHDEEFDRIAGELLHAIDMAFHDYVVASSYIQEASKNWHDSITTREEFYRLYLSMQASGLHVSMVSHNRYVTHSERSALEGEALEYYNAMYPGIEYLGFQGLEPSSEKNGRENGDGVMSIEYRSEQPFYYPSRLVHPVYSNEHFIDFDFYSDPEIRDHINRCTKAWAPTLTSRQGNGSSGYSVFLLNPGIAPPQSGLMLLQEEMGGNHSTMLHHDNRTETSSSPGSYNAGGGHYDGTSNSSSHPQPGGYYDSSPDVLQEKATSFTAIQIQVSDLLGYLAHSPPQEAVYVYIFSGESGDFLSGVRVQASPLPHDTNNTKHWHDDHSNNTSLQFQSEISEEELFQKKLAGQRTLEYDYFPLSSADPNSSSTYWKIYVIAAPESFESNVMITIVAGIFLFMLCAILGLFIHMSIQRMEKFNKLEAKAQQEKAALIVDNASKAAKRERDLNDFIAHEVRNPLAAAMSACSFVSSEVLDEKQPLVPPERYESVKEDIGIIDSSLHFINDLLRDMLDMQRADAKQLQISNAPTHMLNDILRPVDSMLHRRDANFEVILECDPENLIIMTDSLRLKQIILNLARNAVKFVEQGFIRIKATTVEDEYTNETLVQLSVEDSGPGIPEEKRKHLFGKFQESLDSLSQGTGIGLSLCKQLTKLMGAKLWIDEDYDSGYPGCPGTRFVIDLNISPMEWNDETLEGYNVTCPEKGASSNSVSSSEESLNPALATKSNESIQPEDKPETLTMSSSTLLTDISQMSPLSGDDIEVIELPNELSVLFVDDDMVLRKLFSRSVRKVAPNWYIQEAGNGETALQITKTECFDIIFMDQYMASVQKQLLGTETTRALRAQGVTSKICGLSANDVEKAFFEAGADSFMMKPFPFKPDALRRELFRIVNIDRRNCSSRRSSGVSSVDVWVANSV